MSSGALFVEPIAIATGVALVSTNAGPGDDPAAYDAGTFYDTGARVTSGESVYQSVQDRNRGEPVLDPAWWVRVGAINRLRMFDGRVGDQTENPDNIVVVIAPGTIVDVLALKNLQAFSVHVVETTPADGLVYDRTIVLDSVVHDWYEYFFGDFVMQTDAVFADVLPYTDATFTVTIEDATGTARCGELMMGAAVHAGTTEAGVSTGIDDYSLVQPDEFGVRDIVERDFADNMDMVVYVESTRSSTVTRFLTRNRAKPILVIASDQRPDAMVYGLAESWRRVLTYPDMDVLNLTMKGLT